MTERLTRSSAFDTLLRRHRLAAGLSPEQLAERARMSLNGLGALERGERRYP
jgi:transcriptional regulator with XRE-family HTH domain